MQKRQERDAYIGMGSNMGDRQDALLCASALLAEDEAIKVVAKSPIFETAPMYVCTQPDFLNACVHVSTTLEPEVLLARMLAIESMMGRVRALHQGPRLIDLDLLMFDEISYKDEHLTLPHPWMHERAFVLKPLACIAAQVRHPVLGQSISALLELCNNRASVRLYKESGWER